MSKKIGRNDPCPCGSGKKYKACCWKKDQPKSFPDLKQRSLNVMKTGLADKIGKIGSFQNASKKDKVDPPGPEETLEP